MSEATLTNLLEYLYDTLTPNNMRWMAMNLMAHADSDEASLRPYTMEELHQMVAKGEQQFDEGKWQDSEDMFRELEEELISLKIKKSNLKKSHKNEEVLYNPAHAFRNDQHSRGSACHDDQRASK